MKVLIIGGGGREHAIAYSLHKSSKVSEIHAIPGNPGIAKIGTCHYGNVEDIDSILKFVEDNKIDFTVVGPEVPLCLGVVDLLEEHGHLAFGPRQKASMLEGSKVFSKEFMIRHNIPTAKYKSVSTYESALEALKDFSYPVVVKADGLAAGKGVVICENEEVAIKTLSEIMNDKMLKEAGNKVVLEEFLTGYESSLLCFCDGKTILPMVSVKDHKQIFDGNVGPNTGGMGTISPNPFINNETLDVLTKDILEPFVKGLNEEGLDYRGVIFIGLMINNNKAKVLEFNVRFGDPETQSILLRLETDLFDVMKAVATRTLDTISLKWNEKQAGCLVLASDGYPGSYKKGLEITGLDNVDNDVIIFHAGTSAKDDKILTNGGRVLNICALGSSLEDVRSKLYKAADSINFEGKYFRKDIGL